MLKADITEEYLKGFRELEKSFMTKLEVGREVLAMKEGLGDLLEVTRAIAVARQRTGRVHRIRQEGIRRHCIRVS